MIAFRQILFGAVLWCIILFFGGHAIAETRVALVIGNGAYKNAPVLANPRNDATDIAAMLERLGFKVTSVFDADRDAMEDAVERFSQTVESADVALLYYAGHAMQHEGVNYLMPIDASLQNAAGLRRMTRLNDLMADMRRAKALRMVVLDACRDNPIAERLPATNVATRSAGLAKLSTRSLARLSQGNATTAAGGDIIVYAAEAGRTAADGTGRNSPFTASFLRHADREGQEIVQLMRKVTTDVQEATRGEQRPELSLSVPFEFYFKQGSAPAQASVRQLLPQAKPHEAGAIEQAVETIVARVKPEDREQTRREVMAILADLAARSSLRPDQIATELEKAHAQVLKLRADIENFRQITENEPEVAGFIELAAAALSSGRRPDLKAADEALAAAQVRYDAAIQRRTAELGKARTRRAELSEKRGDIAMTEYRFLDAAQLFRTSASDWPEDADGRFMRARLASKASRALYEDGYNFFRTNSLNEAIAMLEKDVLPVMESQEATSDDEKEKKARNQAIVLNQIALGQEALGLRTFGVDGFQMVINSRRTYTRAIDFLMPYESLQSIEVLIDILDNRASRDTGFGSRANAERALPYFEHAVRVQRAILSLRAKYPTLALDIARTRNNLAYALSQQSKRLPDAAAVEALDESIELLRAALKDFESGANEQRKIISRTSLAEVLGMRAMRNSGEAQARDIEEASQRFEELRSQVSVEKQPRLFVNLMSRYVVHARHVLSLQDPKSSSEVFEQFRRLYDVQRSAFEYTNEESAPAEWALAVAEMGHTLVAAMHFATAEDKKQLAEQSEGFFRFARSKFLHSMNYYQEERVDESEARRDRLLEEQR